MIPLKTTYIDIIPLNKSFFNRKLQDYEVYYAPPQQTQGGMDAAERHHSVRDPTDQNTPIRDPYGRRSGLSAKEKVDKTKGDSRGDLQRQADQANGGDQ